jgi:hypothetical protein
MHWKLCLLIPFWICWIGVFVIEANSGTIGEGFAIYSDFDIAVSKNIVFQILLLILGGFAVLFARIVPLALFIQILVDFVRRKKAKQGH